MISSLSSDWEDYEDEAGGARGDVPMPNVSVDQFSRTGSASRKSGGRSGVVAVVLQHPSVLAKPCTACDNPLPLSAFAADHRASDGRQSQCRVCQVARRRTQRRPRRIANLLASECKEMSRDDVYAFIAREAGNGRRVDRQVVIRMAGLVMRRDANGTRMYSPAPQRKHFPTTQKAANA